MKTTHIVNRKRVDDHFSIIPNEIIRDASLSGRARAILIWVLSHSDGFRVTSAAIQAAFPEGRDAIRTAIRNLIDRGYVEMNRMRGEGGKMGGCTYVWHAQRRTTEHNHAPRPTGNPSPENPTITPDNEASCAENQSLDNGGVSAGNQRLETRPLKKTSSKNTKKTPQPPKGGHSVELPHGKAFASAWDEWVTHRSEIRKKLTPTSVSRQLKKLGTMSEKEAIVTIEHTIEMGWTGLRSPDKPKGAERQVYRVVPTKKAAPKPQPKPEELPSEEDLQAFRAGLQNLKAGRAQ